MKKLSKQLEDTILDYLDNKLDPAQREIFEKTLKENILVKNRLEELRVADNALRHTGLEHPSKNFTTTVMGKLDQYPLRAGLGIRNGIMLLSGILIIMAIAVILLNAGVFDQRTTLDLNTTGMAQRYLNQSLPSIPLDGKLIVNVIILLDLALALVVLDRAILKPFFQRRIHAGH